jgi:OmpA-OmpF porin, OOP family
MKSNRETGTGVCRCGEPPRATLHRGGSVAVLAVILAALLGSCSLLGGRAAPPPPPPPPPVVAAPPPPPPVAKRIVLRGVNFDGNSSIVRKDAQPILDEAIRSLRDEPRISVLLAGYADAKEPGAMKLSKKRAAAVRAYLVSHGIAASRIHSEGFGAADPVASNARADGGAQNRRVEIRAVD